MRISDLTNQAQVVLPNKLVLYIPTKGGADQDAFDNAEHVEQAAKLLSEWFGGATANAGQGYYASADFGLIREDVTLLAAFATDADLTKYQSSLLAYVLDLKEGLAQESIAIELNGELNLL